MKLLHARTPGPWLLLSLVAACSSSGPAVPGNGAAGAPGAGASSAPVAGAGGATPSSAGGGSSAAGAAPAAGAPGAAGAGGTGGAGGAGGAPAAGAGPSGGAPSIAPFPPLTADVTLHIAGDSTAAIFPATDPTGRVGWGAVAQPLFSGGVTIDDAAQSGRSSKSFIAEGFWSSLKARIHTGDYVFIGFGHNDEKVDDAERYTDPNTTYRTFLKQYISESRALGGYPVLLTPISRKNYNAGKITPSHGLYPAAVMAVGSETGTPVIDMTDKTRIWLEALGPVAALPYFATDDNTHLSAMGAPVVARLVMEGVTELGLPIAQRLVPPVQTP